MERKKRPRRPAVKEIRRLTEKEVMEHLSWPGFFAGKSIVLEMTDGTLLVPTQGEDGWGPGGLLQIEGDDTYLIEVEDEPDDEPDDDE